MKKSAEILFLDWIIAFAKTLAPTEDGQHSRLQWTL